MSISPEILAELLDRHRGVLLAWVGSCDGLAEDVVQRAFIALAAESVVPDHRRRCWRLPNAREQNRCGPS